MRAAPVLIALAWLVSTVGLPCTFGGRAFNVPFVVAILVVTVGGAIDWQALRPSRNRLLIGLIGLGMLAFVVPALAHGVTARVWFSAGRGCAVIAWFACLLAIGRERLRQELQWAALVLLTGNLALALASWWLPSVWSAFEIAQHEYVGGWPRFRGLANSPAPAGVWALVGIGLGETSPRRDLRWLTRTLGLAEACATFSVPLLAVPALLVALVQATAPRRILVGVAVAVAASVLYFQPLELTVGGRTLTLSRLHPSYTTEGLGARHMPQRTLALPGLALRGHATAYGKLAFRGFTCFMEHPLVGVGPGNFREACRVMAMNTFGEWSDHRDSHNQLGGPLAELGVLGVGLLCGAWLVLRRRCRLLTLTAWQRAVWVGLLVCGFGSEDLFTLPVLALLATQLESTRPSFPPRSAAGRATASEPEESRT